MNERPLVAFTLLTQMGVGAFIGLVAIELSAGDPASRVSLEAATGNILFVVIPVVVAGLLSSVLHLGKPRNAWRALANLRSSWLSREVLLALVFAALACAFAALRWSGAGSFVIPSLLGGAASIAGAALLYAMARVYRLRTLVRWDTPVTTLSFVASALLLGSQLIAASIVVGPGDADVIAARPLHLAALLAAACFAVEIAIEERGTPHAVRRILLLAGLVLSGIQVIADGRATLAMLIAFPLAVAAQVLGRTRFYGAGLRRTL